MGSAVYIPHNGLAKALRQTRPAATGPLSKRLASEASRSTTIVGQEQHPPATIGSVNKVLSWIALVIAGCGIFLNLPAFVSGLSLLARWIQVQTSHGPYFRWPYFAAGLVWLLLSGVGLSLAAWAVHAKIFRVSASVASLFLGLECIFASFAYKPDASMTNANMKILRHVDISLSDWDDAHGRLPSNEEELRKAVAARPLQEPAVYFRQGDPIPYDVRIEVNATGPSVGTVPANPGTVVYAVSSDYKYYWLTVTTLRSPEAGPVIWQHVISGPIWVVQREHHSVRGGSNPLSSKSLGIAPD